MGALGFSPNSSRSNSNFEVGCSNINSSLRNQIIPSLCLAQLLKVGLKPLIDPPGRLLDFLLSDQIHSKGNVRPLAEEVNPNSAPDYVIGQSFLIALSSSSVKSRQVVGGYEHHEEGKDAKVCVIPATFLSSSAQEDAMFQLPCSESNCRIEESREKLCVKRNGGNTEGHCRSSRWKEDEEMG